MLPIILTILKVIGIVLLCILGLLILILCCILFVPVRYRAAVSQKKDTDAVLRVHWLLHIISIKAVFREKKLRWKLSVFGIPIRDSNRKAKPKKSRKPHKKKQEQVQETAAEQEPESLVPQEPMSDPAKKPVPETQQEPADGNTAGCEAEAADGCETDSPDTSGGSDRRRGGIFQKIRGILQKIQYTIHNIYDKIKQICHNIRRYLDILEREETAAAWKQCTWAVKHLIHHIRPQNMSGHVLFGMEDPATTGRILSYVCLLFPLYGERLEVQADFEQKVLEADVRMRGRIRVFTVLRIALRLYRDKNVRHVLHWLGK